MKKKKKKKTEIWNRGGQPLSECKRTDTEQAKVRGWMSGQQEKQSTACIVFGNVLLLLQQFFITWMKYLLSLYWELLFAFS